MSIRIRIAGLIASGVLVASACSSGSDSTPDTQAPRATSTVQWLPCGDIECARINVPRVSSDVQGETIALSVYRRAGKKESAPVLFLLPDRTYGDTARERVENAALTMGLVTREYTVISIAPRGSLDSPVLLTDVNILSALDEADDVIAVQDALGLAKASVLGWGTGATAAAALVMTQPDRVVAAVLDSPQDPSVSMVRQAERQIDAMPKLVETAMRWCASHLSCPSNANVAQALSVFKTNLRLGRLDVGVDLDTISRAATNAVADADPQALFVAIGKASEGDGSELLALAGPAPTAESSRAACANVTLSAAQRIASLFRAHTSQKSRHFYMGAEAYTYGFCAELPATQRPIGAVVPAATSREVPVFVTISRGDPVVPPVVPRTMSKNMGWTYQSVYSNRHLVVSVDQAITAQAFEFLNAHQRD